MILKTLSIRQPWAWLIIHGGKDIENRVWQSSYRGPLLIHAAMRMSREEYDGCLYFVSRFNQALANRIPRFSELHRGGVIGQVNMTGCFVKNSSPWFIGPYGFKMENPRPIPFIKTRGMLNFFDVNIPDNYLLPSAGRLATA